MNVKQCNRAQIEELKQAYVSDMIGNPSWGELANAFSIPDDVIFEYYKDVDFAEDDFWCSIKP